ncbi:MAG: oxygen-independent coproporphyrinogen III oxidase [Bacteroidia bacterium]|nr:oxygen-independent coproporphyrinogen III oxidase [Bacteroidia bacterium]
MTDLLSKYDTAVPRYTSYPTVPYWEPETINTEKWKNSVSKMFIKEEGELCIYIHLPFCESLCTFCACNKRITKNHKVEEPYISALLKEWAIYKSLLTSKPKIKEIHLGGGTPTFFSPTNLALLIHEITKDSIISENHEFSIEVHPNFTTEQHLITLGNIGFNRISVGVQDFDFEVQFAINRVQSYEKTKEVIDWARKAGFESVNIDLVYGLPKQTVKNIEYTISHMATLKPERIAFYSYAHVPWKSKGQRRYTEADLPTSSDKWKMYHRGKELLEQQSFASIGMDHFALPTDKLWQAASKGKMHRNFMGYTTTNSKLIIGLGASAISDSWNAFIQNEKEVEKYQEKIEAGELPIMTGHVLNDEDLLLRKLILDLMCIGKTEVINSGLDEVFLREAFQKLQQLEEDDLVTVKSNTISVTVKGAIFIRNICASLDARLWRSGSGQKVFSKAI